MQWDGGGGGKEEEEKKKEGKERKGKESGKRASLTFFFPSTCFCV